MIGAGNGMAERDQESLLRNLLLALRLDPPLLLGLTLLSVIGMFVLYSAGGEDPQLIWRQSVRLAIGFVIMIVLAQISPRNLRLWTPWIFTLGVVLLILVLELGEVGKGARRWLDLGVLRFQPSELMKLGVPMMVAAYLSEKPLPPTLPQLLVASLMVIVPMLLIAKQPDLGTALLIGAAGFFVLFVGGMRWRILLGLVALVPIVAAVAWQFLLHDYQRRRVLTFLNPESDPLGSGYHIIQSKIAIGSGGVYGKGWLNGTQSQLDFLPERSTDFIFSVFGEEFGLVGALILIALYLLVIFRGLFICATAPDSFGRLLAGALSLTFFVYVFVNAGMVTGLLPVVGVPLPLVSYGGTSMVTLLAGFGMLMSIHSHRRRLAT
jgi:rod shape determining protein RodA